MVRPFNPIIGSIHSSPLSIAEDPAGPPLKVNFESADQYFEQGVRFFEDTGIEIAKNRERIFVSKSDEHILSEGYRLEIGTVRRNVAAA